MTIENFLIEQGKYTALVVSIANKCSEVDHIEDLVWVILSEIRNSDDSPVTVVTFRKIEQILSDLINNGLMPWRMRNYNSIALQRDYRLVIDHSSHLYIEKTREQIRYTHNFNTPSLAV